MYAMKLSFSVTKTRKVFSVLYIHNRFIFTTLSPSQGKIENVNSVKKIKLGTNFIILCDAVISMTKENHPLKSGT